MGFFDLLLSKAQRQDKAATRIALQSGLFERCPVCHGVTEAKHPEAFRETTAALVGRMVEERHADIALFDANPEQVIAAITRVAKRLPYHCTCEDL